MKVKHTYQTLFRVSETGLELVGDFVTEVEAIEYAEQEGINSYTVIMTTVIEEVEMKKISTAPRSITQRGSAAGQDDLIDGGKGENEATEREKGPVKNSRTTKK